MIAAAIARSDYFRRSPARRGGPAGHREWLHFCVRDSDVDALINFSIADDAPGVPRGAELERARVVMVAFDGAWEGDVEEVEGDDVEVHRGAVGARFGENRIELSDGVFRVRVRLRDRPLAADLELRPLTFPCVSHKIPIGPGLFTSWLAVPRLVARGVIEIGGRRHLLHEAPAYHDHNWGLHAGRAFSWEWGYALPVDKACPYSVVFARLGDPARTSAAMQGLFLWDGARPSRIFRQAEVAVRREGLLRPAQLFKVPRVMALLAPGPATDVPRQLDVSARGQGDSLTCHFRPDATAQILVPDDERLSTMRIHEARGECDVEGEIRGERFAFQARGFFEFTGA